MATTTLRDRLAGEMLERFITGPFGQKITADLEAETIAKRKAAATELNRLRADLEREVPKLITRKNAAQAAVKKAQAALNAEVEAAQKVEVDVRNTVWRNEQAQSVQRGILAQLAPPSIQAFRDEMIDRIEKMRRVGPAISELPAATPSIWKEDQDNAKAITQRATAAREKFTRQVARTNDVRQICDDLTLTALSEAELVTKFAALRQSIEDA